MTRNCRMADCWPASNTCWVHFGAQPSRKHCCRVKPPCLFACNVHFIVHLYKERLGRPIGQILLFWAALIGLYRDQKLAFQTCDSQEKLILVWARYCRNSISSSCQGTGKRCLWCLQNKKAVWIVLFRNSYRPMSLFLWAKLTGLCSCSFFRIWCFIFRVLLCHACVCVWAFVSACTCSYASVAHRLSNGVLLELEELGREGWERESAA